MRVDELMQWRYTANMALWFIKKFYYEEKMHCESVKFGIPTELQRKVLNGCPEAREFFFRRNGCNSTDGEVTLKGWYGDELCIRDQVADLEEIVAFLDVMMDDMLLANMKKEVSKLESKLGRNKKKLIETVSKPRKSIFDTVSAFDIAASDFLDDLVEEAESSVANEIISNVYAAPKDPEASKGAKPAKKKGNKNG